MEARKLAIVNFKGGSAKTTTTLSLAWCAAARKRRVLLVDADPQANATMVLLEGQAPKGPTLGEILLEPALGPKAIRPTRTPGLDIIPAEEELAATALALGDKLNRDARLRRAMREIEGYDLILIDAAPQVTLLTVNLLNFAPELLVPVDAGLFSVAGLAWLERTVEDVRENLDNPEIRIIGLVITRAQNNRATRDVEAQLREHYGQLVCKAVIPNSVRVEEAHACYRSVTEFAPDTAPALAYQQLTTEVLGDGKASRNRKPHKQSVA